MCLNSCVQEGTLQTLEVMFTRVCVSVINSCRMQLKVNRTRDQCVAALSGWGIPDASHYARTCSARTAAS
jgi:hypothetical protein